MKKQWNKIGLATGVWLLMKAGLYAQTPFYYYENGIKIDVERADNVVLIRPDDPLTSLTVSRNAAADGLKIEDFRGQYIKITGNPAAPSIQKLRMTRSAAGGSVSSKALLVQGNYKTGDDLQYAMVLNPQLAVKLRAGGDIAALCKSYNLKLIEKISFAEDTYFLECLNKDDMLNSLLIANALEESGLVEWACPELEKSETLRLAPNDPLYSSQWHLKNNGTNTLLGIAGNDINVESAWNTVTGAGVVVAIFDDGVQLNHPDLEPNALIDAGWNFVNGTSDPSPTETQNHGTACAGLTAARGNNGIGVSGSAPNASLIGLKKNVSSSGDSVNSSGLVWNADPLRTPNVHISSNSWGPSDSGHGYDSPGPLSLQALNYGINSGRNGKGIIYVWAAGNGRANNDNVNRDGYANHPGVIAVGATLSNGTVTAYSEAGSALLVNAPGGGSSLSHDLITTTDRTGGNGYSSGDYANTFNGTSAACPIAAGVAALMLEKNPNLTYRDVKMIMAKTARKNDPLNSGWKTNGGGLSFNHDYGFGMVNASQAVNWAAAWTNLPPREPEIASSDFTPQSIPDNNAVGVSMSFAVSAPANFVIEYVELQTNISHTYRGDLDISLTAPSGMVSQFQTKNNDGNDNISLWKYRSNAHLGETASGNWTYTVKDLASGDTGILQSAVLSIYGYITPASAVESWALYE